VRVGGELIELRGEALGRPERLDDAAHRLRVGFQTVGPSQATEP
jgi:hypothetical protein